MSQKFTCDFCESTTEHRGAGSPPTWGKVTMYRNKGTSRLPILHIDSCPRCTPIIDMSMDKKDTIDLLKRVHVRNQAAAEVKQGDT